MTDASHTGPDWAAVKFVVFDVDGTLYEQRALQLRMAQELLLDALCKFSLSELKVIRSYRTLRERLAEAEAPDFEAQLLKQTAALSGCPEARVRAIAVEWMETRPRPYLMSSRVPGIGALFAGLKRHGKTIGVLSDYDAHDKLAALGLRADFVLSAPDPRVGLLKPHPKGLQVLMADAGFASAETLLIGDRVERDGYAARRAGASSLIRSGKPRPGWPTFVRYDEPLFAPLLAGAP